MTFGPDISPRIAWSQPQTFCCNVCACACACACVCVCVCVCVCLRVQLECEGTYECSVTGLVFEDSDIKVTKKNGQR